MFKCGGFQSKDFFCVKPLDDQFQKYLASADKTERKQIAENIQKSMLDEYYFVPVFRHAFVNAIGPRIKAAKWQAANDGSMATPARRAGLLWNGRAKRAIHSIPAGASPNEQVVNRAGRRWWLAAGGEASPAD